MRTEEECNGVIRQAAEHCAVPAALVISRLLDNTDWEALRDRSLDKKVLIIAIIAWRDAGMPDYAHGSCQELAAFS